MRYRSRYASASPRVTRSSCVKLGELPALAAAFAPAMNASLHSSTRRRASWMSIRWSRRLAANGISGSHWHVQLRVVGDLERWSATCAAPPSSGRVHLQRRLRRQPHARAALDDDVLLEDVAAEDAGRRRGEDDVHAVPSVEQQRPTRSGGSAYACARTVRPPRAAQNTSSSRAWRPTTGGGAPVRNGAHRSNSSSR